MTAVTGVGGTVGAVGVGRTLHSVFSIPIEKSRTATCNLRLKQQRRNWRHIRWLIIDQISKFTTHYPFAFTRIFYDQDVILRSDFNTFPHFWCMRFDFNLLSHVGDHSSAYNTCTFVLQVNGNFFRDSSVGKLKHRMLLLFVKNYLCHYW